MPKYILETIETINGYYEIEADTLEEAKAIALSDDLTELYEIVWVDGETDWNEDDIYELEDGGSDG
jgi:hypothetical protein